MYLWSATLGAALAEPTLHPASTPDPATSAQDRPGPRTVRVAAAAGVDSWPDARYPLESLRLYVDDTRRGDAAALSWSYTGDVAAWGARSALDHHTLMAGIGALESPWSLAFDGRGSFGLGWTELHLAPRRALILPQGYASIGLGGAARLAPELRAFGPRIDLAASWSPGSKVGVMVSTDLHFWPNDALPRTVAELDAMLTWAPTSRTLLVAGAGATGAWTPGAGAAADPRAWSTGLPPAGSASVRELVAVERSLGRYAFARVELGAQQLVGAERLGHVMALGGGGFRLYRPDLGVDPGPGPFTIQLDVVLPGASKVEVIGGFTGWRPVALWSRGGDRWTIELSLEAGQYEYVYLVDGQPYIPPEAELRRDDGFGGVNGVLVVPRPGTPATPVGAPPALDRTAPLR